MLPFPAAGTVAPLSRARCIPQPETPARWQDRRVIRLLPLLALLFLYPLGRHALARRNRDPFAPPLRFALVKGLVLAVAGLLALFMLRGGAVGFATTLLLLTAAFIALGRWQATFTRRPRVVTIEPEDQPPAS
jgi:hypothetical protein